MRSPHVKLLAATATAAILLTGPANRGCAAAPRERQVTGTPAAGALTIQLGSGRLVRLRAAAANVFAADPKIAEVRPASPGSLFIFGVALGTTTVAAVTDTGGTIAQYQVTVVPSGYITSQAKASVARADPDQQVIARETQTGVSLSGHVTTAAEAERAVSAAKGVLSADGKIDNHLSVAEPVQVSLHVRVAEMSRSLTRELGVSWFSNSRIGSEGRIGISTNTTVSDSTVAGANVVAGLINKGIVNLETAIQALADDQMIHLLAEPNLVALSGEPANFLVGGEFPIPVASNAGNNSISIEFKQYGVSLSFIPTVLSHGEISLHVRPEVSELDKNNGITFAVGNAGSIVVPGLIVRRADTTVMLGSGQSFVIAGLLEDQTTLIGKSVPGIGDVPILGALFRSDNFQRKQTELVIIVTPYIVRPVSDPNALRLPTDGWRTPNDIERILYLRQAAFGSTAGARPPRRIPADAGFMVE